MEEQKGGKTSPSSATATTMSEGSTDPEPKEVRKETEMVPSAEGDASKPKESGSATNPSGGARPAPLGGLNRYKITEKEKENFTKGDSGISDDVRGKKRLEREEKKLQKEKEKDERRKEREKRKAEKEKEREERKRRKEQAEEEAVGEDSDEGDYNQSRKRVRSDFILDEAEVESDDEIEDEDDDDLVKKIEEEEAKIAEEFERLDTDQDTATVQKEISAHRRREMRAEYADIERIAKDYDDRATEYRRDDAVEHVAGERDATIAQRSLLPTINDPKLWVVPCQSGHEKRLTVQLLNKAVWLQKEGGRSSVLSVVTTVNRSGFIYVESFRAIDVKEFCQGIRGLWTHRPLQMVPLNEMSQVLQKPVEVAERKSLERESTGKVKWVRVKRGMYKGDVGMFQEADDLGDSAVVKLVPRVDYDRITQKYSGTSDEKLMEIERGVAEIGVKRRPRPPACLFRKQDARATGGEVKSTRVGSGERFDVFEGEMFKDGYVYKRINFKSIIFSGVEPTPEELAAFEAKSSLDEAEIMVIDASKEAVFVAGERIRVIEGDLKNLIGRIESVEKGKVWIIPELEELKDLGRLPFQRAQLKKHMSVGVHVKVVSGTYVGETGTVVDVREPVVTIWTDVTHEQIESPMSAIVESAEVGSGRHSISSLRVFDMIVLRPSGIALSRTPIGDQSKSVAAIITFVMRDSFRVLTSFGESLDLKLEDIRGKVKSRNAVRDRESNELRVGEEVRVVAGSQKGKKGNAKAFFEYTVFVQSNDLSRNAGIFVCNTAELVKASAIRRDSSRPVDAFKEITASGGSYSRSNRDDPLMGKTVLITSGPWKGHRGKIRASNEETVQLTLEAKPRKISVPRANVTTVGVENGWWTKTKRAGAADDWTGPSWAASASSGNVPATPTWQGVQTPLPAGVEQEKERESVRELPEPEWRSSQPPAASEWNTPQEPAKSWEWEREREWAGPTEQAGSRSDSFVPSVPEEAAREIPVVDAEQEIRYYPNVLVTLQNEEVVVMRVISDAEVECRLSDGSYRSVGTHLVAPVAPQVKDRVRILKGQNRGAIGVLFSVDTLSGDYVVKMTEGSAVGSDIAIVDGNGVAKTAPE